jgi:glycosyltransferase involved in cell wall biosynthesis
MPKTRILLASILKPVADTRMCDKLGRSLAKIPGSEIHLFGGASTITQNQDNLFFHPLLTFKRLSFKRLLAQWKYYKTLHKVKPEIIVVTTPELLPVSILFKILFKAELYYDVQENYFSNITNQNTYPKLLRPLLAQSVKLFERLSARFITHYFLAERSYGRELSFLGKNYTVLENKYLKVTPETSRSVPVKISISKPLNLLYSGTIADVYGIWQAIDLAEKLHKLNPEVRLTIIGYCAQGTTLKNIQEHIKNKAFIKLVGGKFPVPHSEIREAIKSADIGLLAYLPNPSTANCIPTKLFEYMAEGLPMLIPHNLLWEELINKADAGISIDYFNINAAEILNQLGNLTFYVRGIPDDVFWNSEEEKLLTAIQIKC